MRWKGQWGNNYKELEVLTKCVSSSYFTYTSIIIIATQLANSLIDVGMFKLKKKILINSNIHRIGL